MYWVTNYRNDDQPAKRGGLVAHKHSMESIDQRTLEREPYRDQLQTIVHLLRFIQVLIPRSVDGMYSVAANENIMTLK